VALNDGEGADIIREVFDELDWAQNVDAHSIGVHYRDGVVTLTGVVSNETARAAARDAVFRCRAVHTLDDQLSVSGVAPPDPANTEIAIRVDRALECSGVPLHALHAEVRDHVVTVSGRVEWTYERNAIRRCLEDLAVARFVLDRVELVRRPSQDVTVGLVRAALDKYPDTDGDVVHVGMLESGVTLTGIVQSTEQREGVEQAAWSAPHVTSVINQLVVRPL
jgi:osmotically-inducible protein OsmY